MSKFKAVIFDWAGTVIDFGSFAPMGAFVETFAKFGVHVTIADARKPMGLPKRAHISAMLSQPHIAARWTAAQGSAPDESAIDKVYDLFVPLNEEVVSDYCTLVPGTLETVAYLRAKASRSARPPATPARSWSASCRLRPSRAMRPKTSSAPMICRLAARRQSACTSASST